MQVIIYDDENIGYVTASGISYSYKNEMIESTGFCHNYKQFIEAPFATIQMEVSNVANHDNIKLDETTMKRIAKYNKEMECKRVEERIKLKEEQLKELEDKIADREKRWKKIQEFVSNIYEIDVDEENDDDWLEDSYDD